MLKDVVNRGTYVQACALKACTLLEQQQYGILTSKVSYIIVFVKYRNTSDIYCDRVLWINDKTQDIVYTGPAVIQF